MIMSAKEFNANLSDTYGIVISQQAGVDELEKLLTFYLDFAEEITKKMISVYKFEPGQIDVMLTCLEKVKKDRLCLK